MPQQSLQHGTASRTGRALPLGGSRETMPARDFLHHPGWLYARYVRDVMTLDEVAALAGTSRPAIAHALERYGIPRRKAARRFVRPELNDAAWLRCEYEDRRRTTVEIAAQLGVSARTANAALRRFGIPLRPPRHHRPRVN